MPLTRAQKAQQSAVGLLALPEPLLLAVLQCLTAPADQRSVFSAARAHSRLRQAAVAVLNSIAVEGNPQQPGHVALTWAGQQQRLLGVLRYLRRHGERVRNLSLGRFMHPIALRQLPDTLQLRSLELCRLQVQLLPGDGCQGVLGYDGLRALQQLRLSSCTLVDDDTDQVAAALEQLLPQLQHLSLDSVYFHDWESSPVAFSFQALQQQRLQQLTHLELLDVCFGNAEDQAGLAQQQSQVLSCLVDLRLTGLSVEKDEVPARLLSGSAGLTRLELAHLRVQPGGLAGKTQLQHLKLHMCKVPMDAAWTQLLLPQLPSLQQFTHLELASSAFEMAADSTAAAAYSALTASSKLQRLWLQNCTLPAGVWQHVFPAGRQLPHVTALVAFNLKQPSGDGIAVPEGSLLVSCCPGLQSIDVRNLSHSRGAFSSLKGLSALHTLLACTASSEAFGEVCQLTRLRELMVLASQGAQELLLQTTQLRQLTRLEFVGRHNGRSFVREFVAQGPVDEPVWRQVLRHHLDHSDPAVAQAAAAALEAE